MTNDLRSRAKALFHEVLDEPAAARAAFLRARAGTDAELERAVSELLSAHAAAGEFLGRPTFRTAGASTEPSASNDEAAGDTLGRYRLVERIGHGGFGVVWRAEQTSPVRREVALKVLKVGMDTHAVVARFELERQALALMDHPAIARVFDAGATERGRPYFVMELVRGLPITEYAAREGLSTEDKLRLFVVVCRAVQHAHHKGVVHRDLKPGNVLVTDVDGVAAPKVIDFGIAKATSTSSFEQGAVTEQRQVLGTPEYMAPEQADASGLDVDTRADVYSLGVILYELMTGETPFDGRALRRSSWDEVVRTIREVEPNRPSTRVSTRARAAANARSDAVERDLARRLRGDLDWIAMKALEKDRARRYETAGALADDVERHLADLPVLAGPPSRLYQLGKFVRRHRVAVVAAALVFVALVVGVGAALFGLVEARTQRTRAEERERAAQAELRTRTRVSEFLADMLRGAGPAVAQGRDTTVLREILDTTRRSIDAELAQDPAVRAPLLDVMGVVAREIGQFDEAVRLHQESLALLRALHPHGHRDVAATSSDLAVALVAAGRPDEALEHARGAVELLDRQGHGEDRLRAQLVNNLGIVWSAQRRLDEAQDCFVTALRIQRALGNTRSHEDMVPLNNLGELARQRGDLDSARTAWEEYLAIVQASEGPDHPSAILIENNLAALSSDSGQFAEARARLEGVLERCRKVHGEDGFETLLTLENVANASQRMREHARALAEYDAIVAGFAKRRPGDSVELARVHARRGHALLTMKRDTEARDALDVSLAMFTRLAREPREEWVEALSDRASLRASPAEDAQIESELTQAAEMACKIDPQSRVCGLQRNLIAGYWLDRGRLESAVPWIESAIPCFRASKATPPGELATVLGNLAMLHVRLERFAEAEAPARESFDLRRSAPGATSEVNDASTWLTLSLAGQGRTADVERVLEEALAHEREAAQGKLALERGAWRGAAVRAYYARAYAAGRRYAREALQLDMSLEPARRDRAEVAASLSLLASLDGVAGETASAIEHARTALATVQAGKANASAVATQQLFLATTIVQALAREGDLELAREARELAREGLAARRKLLPASDWRLGFSAAVEAATRAEVARLGAPDEPNANTADGDARSAHPSELAEAVAVMERELQPLIDGAFPHPGRVMSLPITIESLARAHDALEKLAPADGHALRAETWRATARRLRAEAPR